MNMHTFPPRAVVECNRGYIYSDNTPNSIQNSPERMEPSFYSTQAFWTFNFLNYHKFIAFHSFVKDICFRLPPHPLAAQKASSSKWR